MSDHGPTPSQKTFDNVFTMKAIPAVIFLGLSAFGLGLFIFAIGIDEFGNVYRRNGWLFGLFAIGTAIAAWRMGHAMQIELAKQELEAEKIRKPKEPAKPTT